MSEQEFFKYQGKCGKGYRKKLKEKRRLDELAKPPTPHERTKAHRLKRCDCVPQEE